MSDQLSLDFTASAPQRRRRAIAASVEQPNLFSSWSANIDVHLISPTEAVAQIAGQEPERAHAWLAGLVGSIRVTARRRIAFPASQLDRLLYLRPPAQVTLDAAATAVGRAQWAAKLGLKPIVVSKDRRRLRAAAKWPAGLRLRDVPWPAVEVIARLNLPLDIEPDAATLAAKKLSAAGTPVATAAAAGSAVVIEARFPSMVEKLGLPGLAYDGGQHTGRFKLPLLSSAPLLEQDVVQVPPGLEKTIRAATSRVKPLTDIGPDFPWTLYGFQAIDAGRAVRILETAGGVLLAGDMGSGKTTVSLALIEHLDLWPMLVVAPLSAFSTWQRQLAEMGRSCFLTTGSPKLAWDEISTGNHEAVVVSYDKLFALSELIERMHFRSIIADEIQRIRTPGSRRSRALRQLAATIPMRIGLSGTPLTNTVADLLPVGAFLAPGEWKPRASNKDLSDLYVGDPTEAVAEHLGSLMVRRRMDQTGVKLAQRNDHRIFMQLTKDQRNALAALEAEAEEAREAGTFDDPSSKIHAFAKLQKMRAIINSPSAAGIPGPNPKVSAAVSLAQDFLDMGRKGVIFVADRTSFRELGAALDKEGIGWVGIWGSTPPQDRIKNEKRFHTDPDIKVVVCTIQAGSESWSASPTGTWLISTAYVYAPSTLAQMEARVHRLNSEVDGPPIEICYIHAQAPGGSLDDRMLEILEQKRELFAQVVDRTSYTDSTKVHMSMGDLVYMMTGKRDETLDKAESDRKRDAKLTEDRKAHARRTLYKGKGRNKTDTDNVYDDGSQATTLETYLDAEADDLLDALAEAADSDDDYEMDADLDDLRA